MLSMIRDSNPGRDGIISAASTLPQASIYTIHTSRATAFLNIHLLLLYI
jgi:hypothetical protein